MHTKYFLGLDYGTGGAKACIMDQDANVIGYSFQEYPIFTQSPRWSEHNAELYWSAACSLIKDCINKTGIESRDIKCIGTSSAMPCLVMVDEAGNPVHNAYNLMDRRAVGQADWIRQHIGEKKMFEITGNRIEDHPVVVNLMWERDNRPKDFRRVNKALTIDGFVRYRMTGRYTMHVSAGWSYGVIYDMREHVFNNEMLKLLGFSQELFPDITGCDEIIGTVTARAAAQCGLAEGTLVAGGQLDCNAGWLGGGAIEEGDVHMNLGTCGNFGIIHRDKNFVPNMIVAAYTIDSKNTNITIPTTTTGGQSLRYIRDNFSQAERAAESLAGIDAYDMLNFQGESVPAGSDGLIILPYLMGERSPIWDVYARGVVFGLSLSHGKGHIVRATMEAVAYALYDSFRLIVDSGKKLRYPLVLNEGGAKSKLWRRIITDVFNVPTVMLKSRTGAPFGDAVLAAVAEGTFKDYAITRERAEYVDLMEPNEKTHTRYMKYFKLYKDIYEHLKTDFKKLSDLQNGQTEV